MAGIFVSYRRDDSQGFAGRLADDLTEILGPDRVFRDIEIPAGSDFTDVLHRAIAASDLLLVVIGKHWAADSKQGYRSRLFEPTDWVRTEIEAAFAQGKQVIPVLVGGARMPEADSLPSSIARITRVQAAELTDRHWRDDIAALAGRLRALWPALADRTPPVGGEEDTPATVLRELGERFLEQVASRRRPRLEPPRLPPTFGQRLLRRLGLGLKRLAATAAIIALIYIGIRLLGDQETLNTLDAFEARLSVAWDRLHQYLARFMG